MNEDRVLIKDIEQLREFMKLEGRKSKENYFNHMMDRILAKKKAL